jgi:hypothetical protein
VQVVATHAVTLLWKTTFVQMHAWSAGVQVLVPNALLRHSCWVLLGDRDSVAQRFKTYSARRQL